MRTSNNARLRALAPLHKHEFMFEDKSLLPPPAVAATVEGDDDAESVGIGRERDSNDVRMNSELWRIPRNTVHTSALAHRAAGNPGKSKPNGHIIASAAAHCSMHSTACGALNTNNWRLLRNAAITHIDDDPHSRTWAYFARNCSASILRRCVFSSKLVTSARCNVCVRTRAHHREQITSLTARHLTLHTRTRPPLRRAADISRLVRDARVVAKFKHCQFRRTDGF